MAAKIQEALGGNIRILALRERWMQVTADSPSCCVS